MIELRTDDLNNPTTTFAIADTLKTTLTDWCCRFLRWIHDEPENDLIIVEG